MGDADITLRHITRRYAEALARPYVPEGPLEILGWADTQLTALERRLDRTLLVRLGGKAHALGIELEYRYEPDLPDRIHEYQGLFRMAQRAERSAERPPPIESVVILLTGRRAPWPEEKSLRTGWRGRRFSGTRFRVDAVYQRTVAELEARASPFWLAFAPLARDASATRMRAVIDSIRRDVPPTEDRWELFAALLVMADVDPWGHNLRKEIEVMIRREPVDMIQVSKTLRDAYERGRHEGIELGEQRGIELGEHRGLEKGIQQMLRGLLARRLHRALTAREQEALAARVAIDPELVQDKALALEGEALASWLRGESAV
ncbi:MAG: hypothetical protein U0359_02560 [Byssovorax sp.]